MTVRLIHPWTGEVDYTYDYVGEAEVERILAAAQSAAPNGPRAASTSAVHCYARLRHVCANNATTSPPE
jgi:hypothetical protein